MPGLFRAFFLGDFGNPWTRLRRLLISRSICLLCLAQARLACLQVRSIRIERASPHDVQRGWSNNEVAGRLRTKSAPIIAAGVQQPGSNPYAISLSTMARELRTVKE
jgi:hypothetical protein